jgi:hypothetical protein
VGGPKGFRAVKQAVVQALLDGDYQHESRNDIREKNLLSIGAVSPTFVAGLVRASRGTDYECSPLHRKHQIDCHLIRTRGWYVKFYFLEPGTVFISVHQ